MASFNADSKDVSMTPSIHKSIYLYNIKEGDIVEIDYELLMSEGKMSFMQSEQHIPFRVKRGDGYLDLDENTKKGFMPSRYLATIKPIESAAFPHVINSNEYEGKVDLLAAVEEQLKLTRISISDQDKRIKTLTSEKIVLEASETKIKTDLENAIRVKDSLATALSEANNVANNADYQKLTADIENLKKEKETAEEAKLAAEDELQKDATGNASEILRLKAELLQKTNDVDLIQKKLNESEEKWDTVETTIRDMTDKLETNEQEISNLKLNQHLNSDVKDIIEDKIHNVETVSIKLHEIESIAEQIGPGSITLDDDVSHINVTLTHLRDLMKGTDLAAFLSSLQQPKGTVEEQVALVQKHITEVNDILNDSYAKVFTEKENVGMPMYGGAIPDGNDIINKAYKIFLTYKETIRSVGLLSAISNQTSESIKSIQNLLLINRDNNPNEHKLLYEELDINTITTDYKLYLKLYTLQTNQLRYDQIAYFLYRFCKASIVTLLTIRSNDSVLILSALAVICNKLLELVAVRKTLDTKNTSISPPSGVISFLRIRSDIANKATRNNPRFLITEEDTSDFTNILNFTYYNTQTEIQHTYDLNTTSIGFDDNFKTGAEQIKFTFGPFNKIYKYFSNEQIYKEKIDNQKKGFSVTILKELETNPVCMVAYGFSGSGKTTTLIKESYTPKYGDDLTPINNPGMVEYLALDSGKNTIILNAYETSKSTGYLNGIYTMLSDIKFSKQVIDGEDRYMCDKTTSDIIRLKCKDKVTESDAKSSESNKTPLTLEDGPKQILIDISNNKVGKNVGLADVLEIILILRKTKSTINNPYSSRTHVILSLSFIDYVDVGVSGTAYKKLYVCDFAGVEQKFDTSRESVLLLGKQPTYIEYYSKALQFMNDIKTDMEKLSNDHTPFFNNIIQFTKDSKQIVDLTTELNGIKDITVSKPADMNRETESIKKLDEDIKSGENLLTSTPAEIEKDIKNWFTENNKKKGTTTAVTQNAAYFKLCNNIINRIKSRSYLDESEITKVNNQMTNQASLNTGSTEFTVFIKAYADTYNKKMAKIDAAIEGDKTDKKDQLQQIETDYNMAMDAYNNQSGTNAENSNKKNRITQQIEQLISRNKTTDLIKKINTALNLFITNLIDKKKMKIEKSKIPIANITANIINTEADGVNYEINLIGKLNPAYEYLETECNERNTEGEYINESLASVRKFIAKSALKHHRNMYPSFDKKCLPIQCSAYYKNCFGKIDYPQGEDDFNKQFADEKTCKINDNKCSTIEPNMMQCIYNDMGEDKDGFDKIKFCIFGTVNLSISANNPPPIPYVYINNLKQILEELDSVDKIMFDNLNNMSIENRKMSYKGYIVIILNELKDNKLLNWKPSDADTEGEKKENSSDGARITFITDAKRLIDEAIKTANNDKAYKTLYDSIAAVVTHIDLVNSTTTIGTLEFIDSITKMGMTETVCATKGDKETDKGADADTKGPGIDADIDADKGADADAKVADTDEDEDADAKVADADAKVADADAKVADADAKVADTDEDEDADAKVADTKGPGIGAGIGAYAKGADTKGPGIGAGIGAYAKGAKKTRNSTQNTNK